MNYRHAYHAGNFADVVKHAVLAHTIDYLKRKETPFRIIDSHAGRGRYRLDALEADRTQEWRAGIGRLVGPQARPLPPALATLMSPYLAVLAVENAPGETTHYPGSPAIAQRLMRAQDTLIANEAHPDERKALEASLGAVRAGAVKVMGLDGWVALRALLPPPERRGVILIDPPFEAEGDLNRLAEALTDGLRRFATGIFLAWYPIKDDRTPRRLAKAVAGAAGDKLLALEVLIQQPRNREALNGCGLLIANPPFPLAGQLTAAAPALARTLARGAGAHCSVRWLKALRGQ